MSNFDDDPESQARGHLENFYEQNYEIYEVNKIKDYVHERVWAIHFDQIYDRAYIFLARIKILQYGKRFEMCDCCDHQEYESKDLKLELDALKIYQGFTVELQVILQVWNLDDRVLKDKDHSKRAQFEKVTLKTVIDISSALNYF